MNRIIKGDFTYETIITYALDNNVKYIDKMEIVIENNITLEKYSWKYDYNMNIFSNHSIFQNVDIFSNILKDGFDEKPNITIKFAPDTECLTVSIDVTYIKDIVILPMAKKRIDFDDIPKINSRISHLEKMLDELREENERMKDMFSKVVIVDSCDGSIKLKTDSIVIGSKEIDDSKL